MSLLADALQPFIVRELVTIAGRMDLIALPDIIISPIAAYDLTFDNADESMSLDFRGADFLSLALAADCCRLSCASFQTVSSLRSEVLQRDNVAWSMVKLYYSAFYAGHTLIRLFGEGCSYFDRQHITRLNAIGSALGNLPAFQIEGGLYRCLLTANGTALKCTKARRGTGGAHESFWDIFGNCFERLAGEILSGPLVRADAQAAFAQLENFRTMLRRRANHCWLSVMRNDLQYRQKFDVWFPSQIRSRDRVILGGIIGEWNRDPMRIELQDGRVGLLGDFSACCVFIIALCHTILVRIAERSTVGARSFIQIGPMAFLNDIRPRNAD